MGENINVATGIGKIENNYGTVNIGDTNTNQMEQIRKDFSSISDEIFKLLKIAEILKSYDQDWSDLQNKEDFERVYNLDYEVKEHLEVLYTDGRPLSKEVGNLLNNINAYIGDFPTLTSVVDALEKYWINEELINEYKGILEQSYKTKKEYQINLFSINTMQRLFEEQIKQLEQIQVIVRMLKASDLYKKENPTKDKSIDISNAPEEIKKFLWLLDIVKKYRIIGGLVFILFVLYLFKDYVYEENKHFIHVNILHTEIAETEKIKLNHIFNASGQFISLYDEIKYKKNSEPSISKNKLTMHFSALNFNDNGLLKYSDIELSTRLNEYGILRSKFEGHIHQKFPQYKSLYDAGLYIVLAIQTKDQKYLNKFDKSWKKFQENCDYETPNFDISNIRSSNDMTIKSLEIFTGIQQWLNK